MYNSFTSAQQAGGMSNLVEAYARTLTQFTHDVELVYPYAGEALNNHLASLTLIISAALAEFAKLDNVTPVAIETMNTLLPKTEQEFHHPGLSKKALIENLTEKVAKYKELMDKVEPNAKAMTELSMQMKNEIDGCRRAMDQIKASPEWQSVKMLTGVKLLSDVMEHGLEATQKVKPKR
jgi:DNA-binding protein H-NS